MTRRRSVLAACAVALAGIAATLAGGAVPAAAATGSDGKVAIAVVMPIVVPADSGALISADDLAVLTGANGLLTRDLDAVDGEQVALAVDPRIIASIRVLGTAAPDSADEWLARLASLSNETFPLAYADADVVGPGQAGTSTRLGPIGFDDAIQSSRFAASGSTASPSPTMNPGDTPPLPTTVDDVVGWDWTTESIAWPAAGTVTSADLPRLLAQGYGTVLLDPANLQADAGARVSFSSAPNLVGLVSDTGLSQGIQSAAGARGDTGFQAALTRLQSDVAAAAADQAPAIRIATLGRDAAGSATRLPETLAAITASTNAKLTTLAAVRSSAPTSATLAESPESAARRAALAEALRLAALDAEYATVAVDPGDITAPRRRDLLSLLSVQWIGDPAWSTEVQRFGKQSVALRNGVQLLNSSDATTFSANPQLPVTVRNTLSVPVRVYVLTRSLTIGFNIPPEKHRVEVVVQPDSSQRTFISSESVQNGRARVQYSLVDSAGREVGTPRTVAIRVQAGWETAGTLVAVVLVLGVFGFGIIRRILRGRRERRATRTEAEGT